jgi:hypothetical protein
MTVQRVSIALSAGDSARSVKFHVEQLGFTCAPQLEGFARARLGAAGIMPAQANAHLAQGIEPWTSPV